MRAAAFSLPHDGATFTESVYDRCRRLIKTGIWAEMDHTNFRSWLTNFTTPEEKYLSACLLDSLMYRSRKQTNSLINELFDRVIPELLTSSSPTNPAPFDWLTYLRSSPQTPEAPVIVVPVLRNSDPPTKSGPTLCRMLSKHLGIRDEHFVWPWRIGEYIQFRKTIAILFIDDFLGTGHQFAEFITSFNLGPLLQNTYSVYTPLTAHEKGIDYLQNAFPTLLLSASERLTHKSNFFHSESTKFLDGHNTIASTWNTYKSLLQRAGFPARPAYRGYGKLGVVYSFSHATPDNSIPLIWWKSPTWKPLFNR